MKQRYDLIISLFIHVHDKRVCVGFVSSPCLVWSRGTRRTTWRTMHGRFCTVSVPKFTKVVRAMDARALLFTC